VGVQVVREEMAAGFKAVGDKVNGINTREGALGHKVNPPGDEVKMVPWGTR